MKKKTIVTALLMAGIAAGVGTQIHAQDTAYVCGGNHSGMHHTAHECIRTLQEQQAAKLLLKSGRQRLHRSKRQRLQLPMLRLQHSQVQL